jgi:hypothetical protein
MTMMEIPIEPDVNIASSMVKSASHEMIHCTAYSESGVPNLDPPKHAGHSCCSFRVQEADAAGVLPRVSLSLFTPSRSEPAPPASPHVSEFSISWTSSHPLAIAASNLFSTSDCSISSHKRASPNPRRNGSWLTFPYRIIRAIHTKRGDVHLYFLVQNPFYYNGFSLLLKMHV